MSAFVVSKDHIDLLVQAVLAGPTEGHWQTPGDPFSWWHDEKRHQADAGTDVTHETHGGHMEIISPSTLGQRLVSECVASVHGRYPDTDPEQGDLPGPIDAYYMGPYVYEPYRRSDMRVLTSATQAFGAEAVEAPESAAFIAVQIKCYEYQSCEHEEWDASEAHAICRAMKEQLLECLPGYGSVDYGDVERVLA